MRVIAICKSKQRRVLLDISLHSNQIEASGAGVRGPLHGQGQAATRWQ